MFILGGSGGRGREEGWRKRPAALWLLGPSRQAADRPPQMSAPRVYVVCWDFKYSVGRPLMCHLDGVRQEFL